MTPGPLADLGEGVQRSSPDDGDVITASELHEESWRAAESSVYQQVMFDQDLLEIILFELQSLLESDPGASDSGWEADFVPFLSVNKSFLNTGSNVLWENMDSLVPVFTLLPWFELDYRGINGYDYTGSADWERFNFYASRIRQFHLKFHPLEISPAYLMELIALPGRPDPFFPVLRSVSLSPNALLGTPSLFFLISPSIQSLSVETCAAPHDFGTPPSELPPPENLTAALLPMAFSARQLTTFRYVGPTNDHIFNCLSKMTSMTDMHFTITNEQNFGPLSLIRSMPSLKKLDLYADHLCGAAVAPPKDDNLTLRLRSLDVQAKEYSHYRVALSLAPEVSEDLSLLFIAPNDVTHFHAALAFYLSSSHRIKDVYARFQDHITTVTDSHSPPSPGLPSQGEAKARFISTLENLENLLSFEVSDIPASMVGSTLPLILGVLPCWSHLTSFRIGVHLQGQAEAPTHLFPGLSFLFTTVWKHCKSLVELGCHFSNSSISEEDLSSVLEGCELSSVECRQNPHPLSNLIIRTGATSLQSRELRLPMARKVLIAAYLEQLFPSLSTIDGTAVEFWNDITVLVQSYRAQRERIMGVKGDTTSTPSAP